jgi:hypothetical protein
MKKNLIGAELDATARGGERRGSALLLALVLTVATSALALSAIYLTGESGMLTRSFDKERDLRYAAEAGLQIGKSRLNVDPYALPDSLYTQIDTNLVIPSASGSGSTNMKVNVYVGPTGSTTGQFGRFASVVAVSSDAAGWTTARRLELAQENFAKYAYWSNAETNMSGTIIYFGNGDNLWGPVWSNDVIHVNSTGATFHDEVGTAKTVSGANYGTFVKGYTENLNPITLPNNTTLGSLPGYASSGNFNFGNPGTNGDETTVRIRLEFVAIDLDGNGDSTGVDEGFFKAYRISASGEVPWLRGDYNTTKASAKNCGDFHGPAGGVQKFLPASLHATGSSWRRDSLMAWYGWSSAQADAHLNLSLDSMMNVPGYTPRCFPGGSPYLVATTRSGATKFGTDTTWTNSTAAAPDVHGGYWVPWPGAIDSRLTSGAKKRQDAAYLFPLYRGQNSGTKGVIYVNGTVGISGVLRGRVTVYATGSIVLLDDFRYATDPASVNFRCTDILGIISAHDIAVADNALNTPPHVSSSASTYKNMDDTKDLYIHAVMMALNTSFRVQNYSTGPTNVNGCSGSNAQRGCLYLTGGLIQDKRGAVGLVSGVGYVKRYSYDRCANYNPPPYFPTTGRYLDNRYYELDPVGLSIGALFAKLTPG